VRRLLVTGGSGYLGSELVRRAAAAGFEVRAPSHGELDVRDANAVARAAVGCAAVVHTAYVQDGPGAWPTIVDGSEAVACAAARAGARLVHLSTDLVFDGRSSAPYREHDEPRPLIPYGEAKLEAERRVLAALPGAVLVRTSLLYGGPRPGRHEQRVLEVLDGRADIGFFVDELRSATHVGDLAAALLELVELDVAGPLHVAGADGVSRLELARLLARSWGRDPAGLGGAVSAGGDRPLDCVLDSSRAQTLLRTRLRGVREALGGRAAGG
jgi:dTDP-4-dehydrorhamnose reductase